MDHFEKFEKQLLSSYESTLAVEGSEICKEVDSILSDDHELLIEKARTYCYICTELKKDAIDKNLFDKCKKFLVNLRNFSDIKNTLNHISRSRKMV